jgi:hypothetical protein
MDKKQNEQDVLTLVYNESEYAEIISSENPDFQIRHNGQDSYFGVEITEFYFSESSARMRNIPNYFNEIIDHNRYRHKKDRKILEVHNFTITSADGTPKGKARGILHELPQPDQYANMIADVITTKNTRISEYERNLTHVNLIILDTGYRLQLARVGDFYKYFFTAAVKTALYASEFREIFIVTILEESRKVYIPLKMILLLADFYLFTELTMDYPWETTEDSSPPSSEPSDPISNIMRMFSRYIKAKTDKVYFRNERGQIEVIFGNSGLIFAKDDVTINDYQ